MFKRSFTFYRRVVHFYFGFYGFIYCWVWLIQLGSLLPLAREEHFQHKLSLAVGIQVMGTFGKNTFVGVILDAAEDMELLKLSLFKTLYAVVSSGAPETKFIWKVFLKDIERYEIILTSVLFSFWKTPGRSTSYW